MTNSFCEINPAGTNCLDKPYACFHYGIKWNPAVISGEVNANGYIVQKVTIEAPPFLTGFQEKEYFEAWRVVDGCVVYENSIDDLEDDCFSYPEIGIAESINKVGEIIYHVKVYWVDKTSIAYREVDRWKYGAVSQAGRLKSSLVFKLSKGLLNFDREDFVFDFIFTNVEEIKENFIKIGRTFYSCERKNERTNYFCFYREAFEQENMSHIFNEVIMQLEKEFKKEE